MKTNRDDIQNLLQITIDSYNSSAKIVSEFASNMSKHGINPMRAQGILYNKVPLTILTTTELCLICIYLHDLTKEPGINPDKLFNPIEIKSALISKIEEQLKDNVVTFNNVAKVADYQYIVPFVSLVDMAKFFDNGLVTYNTATQRGVTVKKFNDIIISVATIRKKAIKEIKNAMLKNKFTMNMISLNILRNGSEKFEYDYKNKTLTIFIDEESQLDIIDGMHRMAASILAVEENPNLTIGTVVNVLNYTEQEAQQFIVQEDKKTPIAKAVISSFNNENESLLMAKNINKFGSEKNNELHNKLAISTAELRLDNKYTTFEIFTKAIERFFKIDNARKSLKIEKHIIHTFNEIIGILKEKGVADFYFNAEMFYGYIFLSAFTFSESDMSEYLEKLLEPTIELLVNDEDKIKDIFVDKKTNRIAENIIMLFEKNINEVIKHEASSI